MATVQQERWREISRYLDEALDLDGDARASWLDQLDVQAPTIAQAVRSLVAEKEQLAGTPLLLETPPIAIHRMGLAGQQLGAYRLESVLGQGGMGTVWLAHRSDGRYEGRVAVKLLNAALIGQPTEQRFVREGSVLAKLRHPNIANLIDAGVAPSGQPYLVLEYVPGEHIDRYAEQHHLDIEARLRLFLDVLAAVGHAHSHLIVHRDIKPSNILVTADGVVKLLDFGIAALLGAGDTGLTREVDPGLTPEYAAPEQLLKHPVTTATDVYALGRVLFMLLAGRHPLQPAGRSFAELARATLDTDAPRPSQLATDAALGHALKGDLDNIVLKALKKDPEERYQTAEALAQDLRSFLAFQPVSARPGSVVYRAGKFVRRHRVPAALAALAVLALVAGLAGTLIESRRAIAHARLAEAERDRADRAAADATAQRDFARRQLARAEAINDLNSFLLADAAAVGKAFTARDLLTRAEQIVARQADDLDGTRLESVLAIGRLYGTLGETGDANRVLERAYEELRATNDPSLRAKASCELSRAVVRTGDVARARQLLYQGLSELPDQSQFKLTRVLCYLCGVGLENWAGDGEKAIVYARAAESLAAESGASSSLLQLRIAMDLADSYRTAGRYAEADGLFSDAYDRLVALGRGETERAGILLNNWGLVLGALGRPRESEQMLRRVVQISSAQGSDALVEPILWANLARALFDLGRYSEGLKLATRAYTEALAKNDTLAADQALLLRARLHLAKGDIERGAALLAEAEAHFRKMFPPAHPAFLAVAIDRIRIPESRGDLPEAASLADRAILLAEGDTRRRSYLPQLLSRRAEIQLKMGRFAQARTDAERSIALARERMPADSHAAGIGIAYLALGEAQAGEGRRAEARASLTAALEHLEATAGSDHPAARRARALLSPT
jgi:tetratricopeptide (TPR) repeat protein